MGLGIGFLLAFGFPILLAEIIPWPDGTTSGTKYALTGVLILILIGIWVIAYRKTRPTYAEYFLQRNQSGKFILIMGVFLLILIFFASYLTLKAEGVADYNFIKFFTTNSLTRFNLSMIELLTQFGRQLSVIRFQIPLGLVYAGVALHWGPKLKMQNMKQIKTKATITLGISVAWVLLITIFAAIGMGYVWKTTEGRNYLLVGLYDEQFTIYFLPNIIFLFVGSMIYFRARQYFWSDSVSPNQNAIGKWIIMAGLIGFNLIFTISPFFPDLLIKDTAISYLIFLFCNTLFSFGLILVIQANDAQMGGCPNQQTRIISRLMWILFFVGILLYFGIFIIREVGINFQLAEIIALYPNLQFGMILTAGFYYTCLYIQQKYFNKEAANK
jgi:hypothetical protein